MYILLKFFQTGILSVPAFLDNACKKNAVRYRQLSRSWPVLGVEVIISKLPPDGNGVQDAPEMKYLDLSGRIVDTKPCHVGV